MTTNSAKTVLKGILDQLGFNKNEILVYLANLELGSAPASKLAKAVGLNRVTAYEVLQRLSKQGLVSIHVKKGTSVKYFRVESIDSLEGKLEERRLRAEEQLQRLEDQKGALRELYQPSSDKPEVSFYQGKEGVKTVIMDTLAQKPKETLSFASGSAVVGFDPTFIQQYYDKRVAMKIPTKGIAPGAKVVKERFSEEVNRKELRQLRFLPAELDTLQHEIEIYGNNVAFTSMKPGDEHGIIIRSKTIAEAMREIHAALWERLEK